MTIEQIRKDFKELLESNHSLSSYNALFDERLVFSDAYPPQNALFTDWWPSSPNSTVLIVYFEEAINRYQVVLFNAVKVTCGKVFEIEILEVSELYHFSNGPSLMRLMEKEISSPLGVKYFQEKENTDHLFLVSIDLDRITQEFPRLVERLCDAIVFLGEVVIAGAENQ